MLHRFLEIIRTGEVQNLLEIAQKMDISPIMVSQIVKELTTKGYLEEIKVGCDKNQTSCSNCPINVSCQVILKHWSLTEKGKAAISIKS
jgi:DNA-binding Lrp family transcriptional regulator